MGRGKNFNPKRKDHENQKPKRAEMTTPLANEGARPLEEKE
ncbi:hypothetical protein LC040_09250 [Bacillus tianshenii]|nr:hypothetical protein LC040_09250 [Bacillus tianshenii]